MKSGRVVLRRRGVFRVSLRWFIALGCIELFAFYFTIGDFESTKALGMKNAAKEEFLNKTGSFDLATMDTQAIVLMHSKSSYKADLFDPFFINADKSVSRKDPVTVDSYPDMGTEQTVQILARLGVGRSSMGKNDAKKLPSWSQIESNYGSEPVVYGLERCQAYRETVAVDKRIVGTSGLFSTGTNVLHRLLINNCSPPSDIRGKKLFQWQVPWGKHNPAEARMQYYAKDREFMNQTSVLPVVTVRHPITWLYALCQYSYSLQWKHNSELCDSALYLENPVLASFGYKSQSYDSLIHLWRDWYLQYFQERRFPMIMVRLEDVIFRPAPVIEEICNCIGGHFDRDTEFKTFHDSVNFGEGHGNHRSAGIVSTFVKYGKPIQSLFSKFAARDWRIIRQVLGHDNGLVEAFHYRLP